MVIIAVVLIFFLPIKLIDKIISLLSIIVTLWLCYTYHEFWMLGCFGFLHVLTLLRFYNQLKERGRTLSLIEKLLASLLEHLPLKVEFYRQGKRVFGNNKPDPRYHITSFEEVDWYFQGKKIGTLRYFTDG